MHNVGLGRPRAFIEGGKGAQRHLLSICWVKKNEKKRMKTLRVNHFIQYGASTDRRGSLDAQCRSAAEDS